MKNRVYFEEHLWMSASKLYFKRDYNTGVFLWTLLFTNTYFVVDLRTAGSETPVRGSLFNKVASVTAWRHLTLSWRRPLSYRNRANQCRANQWTGFYMISVPIMKELAVLKRDLSKGIWHHRPYLWILWNFKEAFLQNTC